VLADPDALLPGQVLALEGGAIGVIGGGVRAVAARLGFGPGAELRQPLACTLSPG
jgi:hypothetical protein